MKSIIFSFVLMASGGLVACKHKRSENYETASGNQANQTFSEGYDQSGNSKKVTEILRLHADGGIKQTVTFQSFHIFSELVQRLSEAPNQRFGKKIPIKIDLKSEYVASGRMDGGWNNNSNLNQSAIVEQLLNKGFPESALKHLKIEIVADTGLDRIEKSKNPGKGRFLYHQLDANTKKGSMLRERLIELAKIANKPQRAANSNQERQNGRVRVLSQYTYKEAISRRADRLLNAYESLKGEKNVKNNNQQIHLSKLEQAIKNTAKTFESTKNHIGNRKHGYGITFSTKGVFHPNDRFTVTNFQPSRYERVLDKLNKAIKKMAPAPKVRSR